MGPHNSIITPFAHSCIRVLHPLSRHHNLTCNLFAFVVDSRMSLGFVMAILSTPEYQEASGTKAKGLKKMPLLLGGG